MIDDSERRAAAERLRQFLLMPWYERSWYHDSLQNVGSLVGTSVGENIVQRLADLIDRPTATATMDYEAMEDGIPDCRIWTCNGCKESFPAYRGFYPTYCPVCGMEIEK